MEAVDEAEESDVAGDGKAIGGRGGEPCGEAVGEVAGTEALLDLGGRNDDDGSVATDEAGEADGDATDDGDDTTGMIAGERLGGREGAGSVSSVSSVERPAGVDEAAGGREWISAALLCGGEAVMRH